MVESLCGVHALYMRIPNIQCMFIHIVLHAAGPSGSVTPPAIPLAAPSTPRTQPQPSTSAAAALRNQPAVTSQVALVICLLELGQLSYCMHSRFIVLRYHQHCLSVFQFPSHPATEVMQHANIYIERSSLEQVSTSRLQLNAPGRQTC